jgi:hypothetical protein
LNIVTRSRRLALKGRLMSDNNESAASNQ